jgi:hypothetical protein
MALTNSDVISAFAVLIAAGALVLSVREATANRPRIRLSHAFAFGVGGLEGDWIVINVINWGRQPTMINGVSIEFTSFVGRDGNPQHAPHIPQSQRGTKIGDQAPLFLEVGKEANFYFPLGPSDLEQEAGTIRALMKQHGATARVSTSWATKPMRRQISAPN